MHISTHMHACARAHTHTHMFYEALGKDTGKKIPIPWGPDVILPGSWQRDVSTWEKQKEARPVARDSYRVSKVKEAEDTWACVWNTWLH